MDDLLVVLKLDDVATEIRKILEIPEDIFWFADYSFLLGVVEDKTAYDNWLNYVLERERKNNK